MIGVEHEHGYPYAAWIQKTFGSVSVGVPASSPLYTLDPGQTFRRCAPTRVFPPLVRSQDLFSGEPLHFLRRQREPLISQLA